MSPEEDVGRLRNLLNKNDEFDTAAGEVTRVRLTRLQDAENYVRSEKTCRCVGDKEGGDICPEKSH